MYPNFNEFFDDMCSEIIGMCLEAGLIYFIIEKSLANEREREKRKREKEVYDTLLEFELDYFLLDLED